jgi:hypothetical protein
MTEALSRIQKLLNAQRLAENLTSLFCETLRWGAPRRMAPRMVAVGAPVGKTLTGHPVAQLSGLPVYRA